MTGIRVVRAYNAESYQEEKFERASSELTSTNLFANRIMALLMPTMTLVTSRMSLTTYWIGAYLINAAEMAERLSIFSDMVVFSSYAMQVILAFTMLTILFIMLPYVLVSAKRINRGIDTKTQMKNGHITISERKMNIPVIEFRNVGFQYPNVREDVLHNISFQIYAGETVVIIGATASGKSTLIHLIPRLYDTHTGDGFVDGINVRDYDKRILREKIGFATQKAILFSGSVSSNVAYGSIAENQIDVLMHYKRHRHWISSVKCQIQSIQILHKAVAMFLVVKSNGCQLLVLFINSQKFIFFMIPFRH